MKNIGVAAHLHLLTQGVYPVGTNAQIAATLLKLGGVDQDMFNQQGELVDRWGHPFQFIVTHDEFCVISSGDDQRFDTFDDLVYVDHRD